MNEWKNTRLIQRLKTPKGNHSNPYSFGAGSSGLNRETGKNVAQVFDFDYMGQAEYEGGIVAKTLAAMWEDRTKLTSFELTLKDQEIFPYYVKTINGRTFGASATDKAARPLAPKYSQVYVLCREEDRANAEWLVRKLARWADTARYGAPNLKAGALFANSLREHEDDYERCTGWLDLDHGVFFSVDRTMFEKTAEMLEVELIAGVTL